MTSYLMRDVAVSYEQHDQLDDILRKEAAARLSLGENEISSVEIYRRALDTRRGRIRAVYTVLATPTQTPKRLRQAEVFQAPNHQVYTLESPPEGPKPVVVGAGPAGLFAALTLARAGWPPVIIERGKPVEERGRDVSRLYAHGALNPESNVCFGEGGAGTYSDGKLYTRVNDIRTRAILRSMVELGARPDLLINNRPHVGTDKLVVLLRNMRASLLDMGAQFRFNTRCEGFVITSGKLTGLRLAGGESLDATHTIVATGHSARGVWHQLERAGAQLEARPIAVGFRIEHPQALINEIRYGSAASDDRLPTADYRLAHNEDNERSAYSFCMCPGGVVVATPTEPDALCINGMSHAARSGKFANSALVVSVSLTDYADAGFRGIYAGAHFQDQAERHGFQMGGGAFVAPAMRVTDYVAGRTSSALGATSYRRGLTAANIHDIYPGVVHQTLKHALQRFDKKMRGFVSEEAQLIGVETRTASPVRVLRDDTHQCVGVGGLYPVGEGMGYGGGIVSAALDGVRCAETILQHMGATARVIPV